MLRHVDLCSGIGGFALGFEWAELSSPVLFCDIEPWSRKILAKHWPDVPIAEDVKELANDPDGLIPDCDILTAGYPCQPFSVAGQRRGTEDDRHIWPYILSIVKAKRPSWCVFENVYGHVSMGLDEVLSDLEGEGYAARPFIVPACAADAPHRRDRVWIIGRNVAETDIFNRGGIEKSRKPKRQTWGQSPSNSGSDVANAQSKCRNERFNAKCEQTSQQKGLQTQIGTSCSDVADTDSKSREAQHQRCVLGEQNIKGAARGYTNGSVQEGRFWLPEPAVGRVANGIPRRVDRLRGLGNAIVPQIAMRIGMTIKETG